ncbi:hypothetical protein BSLG_009371 [Batrachochytrium salamandrivorans]|nr:hypothetical protein BSLG_009371 [Batrachochytrium salamandrivorans]
MAPLLRISTGASMSMHHILSTTRRTVIGFTTRPAVTTRRTVVPTVKALDPWIPRWHSLKANLRFSSESHTPIFRIDANSVASNTPIEDYYAHAKFGNGILLGMFDGHGGPECGRIVSKYLLSYIAKAITDLNLKKQEPGMERTADHHRAIKHAIKTAFVRLDTDIINGAFTTSGNIAAEVVSRGTIASWILGLAAFSRNECLASLRTSLSGACALVAYIDGDDVVPLSADQTFKNPKEYARLVDDHPGEDVIIKGRILGGLMPTRAFGDARYKWTKYQQRVILPSLYPDGRRGIPRNYKTPPYVTAEPEVIHYERDTHDEFLIMATDGLWDEVTSDISAQLVGDKFGRGATKDSASAVASATDAAVVDVGANAASVLVWSALSDGDTVPDNDRIRHILSISNGKSRRYRDDITVNVAYFGNGSSEHYGESGLRKPIPGAVGIPMVDLGLAKPKHHHLTSWVEFLKHQPTQSSGYPTSKL